MARRGSSEPPSIKVTPPTRQNIKKRKFVNSAPNLCATPQRASPHPRHISVVSKGQRQRGYDCNQWMTCAHACAAVSSVGAGRSGRRGKFVRDTGRWQHCRLHCCVATGNPSLDQVFISLSLFSSLYPLSLSVTRYCELKGTKRHYCILVHSINITATVVKFHRTKELFVCNPSWCPCNRTTGLGTRNYGKRLCSNYIQTSRQTKEFKHTK